MGGSKPAGRWSRDLPPATCCLPPALRRQPVLADVWLVGPAPAGVPDASKPTQPHAALACHCLSLPCSLHTPSALVLPWRLLLLLPLVLLLLSDHSALRLQPPGRADCSQDGSGERPRGKWACLARLLPSLLLRGTAGAGPGCCNAPGASPAGPTRHAVPPPPTQAHTRAVAAIGRRLRGLRRLDLVVLDVLETALVELSGGWHGTAWRRYRLARLGRRRGTHSLC